MKRSASGVLAAEYICLRELFRTSNSRSPRCCRRPELRHALVFTKVCNSQEARPDSLPAGLRATQPRPEVSGAPGRPTLYQSRSRLETVAPYCEPGAIQSLLSAIWESGPSVPHCSACIHAATRSPIMMHGYLYSPAFGIADAATTRSPSIPSHRQYWSHDHAIAGRTYFRESTIS